MKPKAPLVKVAVVLEQPEPLPVCLRRRAAPIPTVAVRVPVRVLPIHRIRKQVSLSPNLFYVFLRQEQTKRDPKLFAIPVSRPETRSLKEYLFSSFHLIFHAYSRTQTQISFFLIVNYHSINIYYFFKSPSWAIAPSVNFYFGFACPFSLITATSPRADSSRGTQSVDGSPLDFIFFCFFFYCFFRRQVQYFLSCHATQGCLVIRVGSSFRVELITNKPYECRMCRLWGRFFATFPHLISSLCAQHFHHWLI